MQSRKIKIVVTGGGSGGHTIPALVMIKHWKMHPSVGEIFYLASEKGIERQVISPWVDGYFAISTGKLRRYFSLENILDFFRFLKGIIQAFILLFKLKPDVVFSTGGFVALPVVIAAKVLAIKVVIHEQTTHVGLANKLSSYFADHICISFMSSASYFPKNRTIFTGYPLRPEFFEKVSKLTSFKGKDFPKDKKILLILGGGNGSSLLNSFVLKNLEFLCENFSVVLQTGKQFEGDFSKINHPFFWSFSFLEKEMMSLILTSDFVIARAGAGTVCELMHLKKPTLFVPLTIAQKNEQWHNAKAAQKISPTLVISEAEWKQMGVDQVVGMIQQQLREGITDVNFQSTAQEINSTQQISQVVLGC